MDSPVSSSVPTVLITGFGPFRSVSRNPSWEVAKALKEEKIDVLVTDHLDDLPLMKQSINNIIVNNSCLKFGSNTYHQGGGICLDDANPHIYNNIIVNNISAYGEQCNYDCRR